MKRFYSLIVLAVFLCCGTTVWGAVSVLSEGFESNNLATNGWTRQSCHSKSIIGTEAKHDGYYGFLFYYNTNPPQYLISKALAIPSSASEVNVSLYYKAYSSYGTEKFQVGYSTTDNNVANFTWDTEVSTNSTSWAQYTNSSAFPKETKYIAIRYNANDQYRLYIDDIEVTCNVSGPSLSVFDGETALSSGDSYNFGLATAGTTKTFTLKNDGTEATPVAVAHTGSFDAALSAASIPAGGEVTLTVTMPAASGSDVITISSTAESIDDFVINVIGTIRDASKVYETLLGGSLPEDWTYTGTWYWNTTTGAYNTTYYESGNYRLITPQLTVSASEQFFVEVQGRYDGYQGFKLEYSADGSTWTSSATVPTITSEWQTLSFNDVPEGKYYIALHGWQVNVRNFYGGSIPSVPKNITLDSKTANSLTLSWTPAGSETAWKLQHSTDGENWSDEVAASTNPFELTGLSANTLYYVRVRADIESSEWSKVESFRTACGAIDALPYVENFEGHDLNAAPLCWELLNATSTSLSTRPYVAISAQSGYYKDAKALFFRTDNTKVSYAIFPEFSFSLAKAEIAFSHKEESGIGTLVLGYLTDIEDASTFVALYNCTSSSSWTDEEGISLAAVTEGARLAFQHTVTSSYYDAAVDNITISLAPACVKPTGLGYSENAAHSVKLSWTSDKSAWKVEYSENSDFSASTVKDATENPYVLSGLEANTHYYVRVLTNCGGDGESEPTAAIDFTTKCEDATLPLTEDFESGVLPECWSAASQWATYAYSSGHNSSTSMRFNASATGDLTLRDIYLAEAAQISFWRKSDYVSCGVYINDGTGLTQLGENFAKNSSWKKDSIDLSSYTGKTVTLVIRGNYYGSGRYLYIDDIAVTYKPVAAPTNVVATPADQSATITWESTEGTSWNLRYKATDAAKWDTIVVEAKTKTLDGLDNGTEYEVQIQAVCSANRKSEWTASENFTPIACPTVTKVTFGATTYNSVVVNWTTSGAGTWDIRYKAAGDEDWTVAGTELTEATKTLTSLTTGATYTVAVKPHCGGDEAWVAAGETFTPVYTEPEVAEAASITDASATVTWGAVSDAAGYEVALTLRKVAVSEWKATTKTDTTFSNLAAATEYDFFVRAKYATGESTADSIGFATITIAPKNLQQDGESTTDGATFIWEANGAATQYQWSIDNTNWSAAQTALTATVEGLNPGSTYTFYVRSWYADNVYSSAISKAFDTKCADKELGWSENFEGSNLPNCWDNSNYSGWSSSYIWKVSSDEKKSGSNSIKIQSYKYTYSTYYADLETPSISITDNANLTYYWKSESGVPYKVLMKVNGVETELKAFENASHSWTNQEVIAIPDTCVGKKITIIFRGLAAGTSNRTLFIDDVAVVAQPCVTPTGLATAASKGSATITWTDDEADRWNLRYRVVKAEEPFNDWEYVNNLDVKSHTLNGLAEESEYEVQVQAVCSSARSSEWTASVNFTPACPTPGEITFTNKTYNGVIVSWTPGGSETAWNLEYQKGETGWTPVLTNPLSTTSYTFTDLETGSPYSFRVQAACEGEWTAIANYTPQYSAPASASVTEPTDTTATASWAAVADAPNGYQYIVVEREATPDWDSEAVKSTTETSALLTKLAGLTDYDFYVRAVYGLNHGEATKAQFTTIAYAPQNLQQGATDTESAVFTWEANGAATQYQWSLDDTNWSAAQTALTAKVEGLSAGTAYTFYVRSYYADGKYSSSINLPFNTACDVESIGYTQDFEAGGKPLCWVVDDANWAETFSQGSTGNKWSNRGGSTTHSGNYALYYNSKTSTANSADITMPNIVIDKAAKLIFYIKNNYEVTGEVRVAAEEKETAITALKKTGNDFNTLQEIDLSDFVGKTVTITFHAQGAGTSENSSLAIDDIEVAPICTKPTNLAATATVGGADVTWDGDEDQYQYCVVNSGNDPSGWILLESYVKSVSITGKVEGKTYDVYVRAYCGAANQSEAVMTTFTTQSTPTGVDNVADDAKVIKLIENDQLVIIRDGIKYNAQGKRLGEYNFN